MSTTFGATTTAQEIVDALASNIRGKNVLITGASAGSLGSEVVRVLARDAKLIVIAGRNQARTDGIIKTILSETPSANLRSLLLDLASFASVRHAAAEVNAYTEPIDILINNAGIWEAEYVKTSDGIERTFQTNHLSHFLFTALIFPKIRERIVNVASSAFTVSGIRFGDLTWSGEGGTEEGKEYHHFGAYGQSKTANILFTQELARRYASRGLLAYSLHPGGIVTNILPTIPKKDQIAIGVLLPDGETNPAIDWKTLAQGAATYIVAAFDPSIKEQSGAYLVDCKIANDVLVPHASDPDAAAKLWTLSEELTGVKF